MRSGVPVWLTLVALLALGMPLQPRSGIAQVSRTSESCGDVAVATAPLTPGSPLVSNEVVLSESGGEPVSSVPFDEPAEVIPTSYEDRALVRSLGNEYGVLDIRASTVTMLEFEGADPGSITHRSNLFSETQGSRFQLFGDNLGREGFLVDLNSGQTINVNDLLPEPATFLTGAVSSNDHWLLLSDGDATYLIDLTSFQPGIEVNSGRQARNVHFLAEGESIVFARDVGDAGFEIVVQALPSGTATIIAPADQWLGVRVLAENAILAWQNGTLFHLPFDGSGPKAILEASGELAPMSIDPSGQQVLVRRILSDETSWFLASLDGLPATDLPNLDGLQLMHPQDTADWALFATAFEPLQGVPGTPYVGLDLQTETVSTLLIQDETGIYVVSPSTSPDGRYHLVQSIAPAYGRLWLLDAAMNGSSLVAESGGNAVGMISPDGCYLAMSTFAALGEGRQGQVEVRDLRSGEVRATIPDAVLLGWVRT